MATARLTITELGENNITASGQRTGGCASCSKNQDCASANVDQQPQLTMVLPRHASAAVGQQIEVDCEEALISKALGRLFLPPLFGLCALPLILSLFIQTEVLLLSASGLGFALGLVCSAKLSQNLAKALQTQVQETAPQQITYQIKPKTES